MSLVNAATPAMQLTAESLMGVGSAVTAGNAAGAMPTTGVIPPAAHPAAIAHTAMMGVHGGMYQGMSAISTAIHEMFVATLGLSAVSYAATEATNSINL